MSKALWLAHLVPVVRQDGLYELNGKHPDTGGANRPDDVGFGAPGDELESVRPPISESGPVG
jgi:hypothetical protein